MNRFHLTKAEQFDVDLLRRNHYGVRVWRRKDGAIMLSREAMHTPGQRERFCIRRQAKEKKG